MPSLHKVVTEKPSIIISLLTLPLSSRVEHLLAHMLQLTFEPAAEHSVIFLLQFSATAQTALICTVYLYKGP